MRKDIELKLMIHLNSIGIINKYIKFLRRIL